MIALVLCGLLGVVSANWPFDNRNNPFDTSNPASSWSHFTNSMRKLDDNMQQLRDTFHGERKYVDDVYEIVLSLRISDSRYIHINSFRNMVNINADDGYSYYRNSIQLPSDVEPTCHWYYNQNLLTLRFPLKKKTSDTTEGPVQGIYEPTPDIHQTPIGETQQSLDDTYEISLPFKISDSKYIRVTTLGNRVNINADDGTMYYRHSLQLPNNVEPECHWSYNNEVLTLRFPVRGQIVQKADQQQSSYNNQQEDNKGDTVASVELEADNKYNKVQRWDYRQA